MWGHKILSGVVANALEYDHYLSEKYGAKDLFEKKTPNVFVLSRFVEYFVISQHLKKRRGVVSICRKPRKVLACNEMIPATIFMPVTTPQQKIGQVRFFGGDYATIKLVEDTLMR